MVRSTACVASSLLAFAMAAIHAEPAAAQTATNVQCDGCVSSTDIQDGSVRAQDLVPGLTFGTTILVQPGASVTDNCTRLRDALAGITGSSAARPVLVRLGRGTYNCGSTPLALKAAVTIEGAGRNFSRIIGNADGADQGVVQGANEAALRHLTVIHAANGAVTGTAINTLGRQMSLTDVAIKIDTATAFSVLGILASGGLLGLTDVSININSTNGGGQGIDARSGAKLDMMNVWIRSYATAGNPAAIQLVDSSVTGYGILFSANVFGLIGVGNSVFELVDGTVIGARGTDNEFTGSFSCVGIAAADFTARAADCS